MWTVDNQQNLINWLMSILMRVNDLKIECLKCVYCDLIECCYSSTCPSSTPYFFFLMSPQLLAPFPYSPFCSAFSVVILVIIVVAIDRNYPKSIHFSSSFSDLLMSQSIRELSRFCCERLLSGSSLSQSCVVYLFEVFSFFFFFSF